MNINLEYPLDIDKLLRKKKSIKKELLNKKKSGRKEYSHTWWIDNI